MKKLGMLLTLAFVTSFSGCGGEPIEGAETTRQGLWLCRYVDGDGHLYSCYDEQTGTICVSTWDGQWSPYSCRLGSHIL
jgi:hypothetical protein